MSKKKQEDLEKNGFNFKRAAEASIVGLGSVSSSAEIGMTTEDTKKYEESIENSKIVTVGSKLPEDGKILSSDLEGLYVIKVNRSKSLDLHNGLRFMNSSAAFYFQPFKIFNLHIFQMLLLFPYSTNVWSAAKK